MKKTMIALLLIGMLGWHTVAAGAAAAERADMPAVRPLVELEGFPLEFGALHPFIVEGTTLAPADSFLDMLGYTVTWDAEAGTVAAEKGDLRLLYTVDAPIASIGGEQVPLLQAPRLVDGIPFVPLRVSAEADGRPVVWHGEQQKITIGMQDAGATIRFLVPAPAEDDAGAFEGSLDKLGELVRAETGIRVQWITASAHYQDRLNLMIASGDVPHLGYIPDPALYPADLIPAFAMDVKEAVRDYPNLAALPAESEIVLPDGGGLYGIPKVASPTDAPFPVVRQDWLDRLGLAVPQTMDELYEVLRQFSEEDPDGNGVHDTLGLAGSIEGGELFGSLAWVSRVFNESPTRFIREGGVIVDTVTQAGTREALVWLNRAYADGLLAADFPVMTNAQAFESVQSGQAGVMAMTVTDAWEAQSALRKTSDTALLTPLVSLQPGHESAAVAAARAAHDGMFFISGFATEQEAKHALTVLDTLLSPELEADLDRELEAVLESTLGVNRLHELPDPRISADDQSAFEAILAEREALLDSTDVAYIPEQQIMMNLSNDQKALKLNLDRVILETKLRVVLGIVPIGDWDEFVAELESDSRYIELMDAINA